MSPTRKKSRRKKNATREPAPTGKKTLVVAEKPSVARDLARVLGANQRRNGYLEGDDWLVTWAIGHLVRLPEPHEIRPDWKRWRRSALPMLPEEWPLAVQEKTREQFAVVKRLLRARAVTGVVSATDAGREGELIFRYLYEAAGARKSVRRLWISNMTTAAIRQGFLNLRPAEDFDGLADAARGRSRADWLVGMNLSRATSLAADETLPVGRVQTPTLAMVVERELEIRAFVPQTYFEVEATFEGRPVSDASFEGTSEEGSPVVWKGRYLADPKDQKAFRFFVPDEAKAGGEKKESAEGPGPEEQVAAIIERCLNAPARVESLDARQRSMAAPRFYDLTELQRHANRLWGWSAKRTLQVAQGLYEGRKLITYPRTDSRHIAPENEAELPQVVAAIEHRYAGKLAAGTGQKKLGKRFVDGSKVTDHHAILPTENRAPESLSGDEARLYDLVCRRLLMAWHVPWKTATTIVITLVESEAGDRFQSRGTQTLDPGWKVLDLELPRGRGRKKKSSKASKEESQLPAELKEGFPGRCALLESQKKETRPPRRFTEATLLTAMETAGKTLDERELEEAMRDRGLGTPATRAETIEGLLRRGYIERLKKALAATEKGIDLIARVHPMVKSPALTGEWEAQLKAIERGEGELSVFWQGIEDFVREAVGRTFGEAAGNATAPAAEDQPPEEPGTLNLFEGEDWAAASPAPGGVPESSPGPSRAPVAAPGASPARTSPSETFLQQASPDEEAPAKPPARKRARTRARAGAPLEIKLVLAERFGFDDFRPFQERVCEAVVAGRDVLLVMPTGAGKSLCYQLPGIARGGSTLVVSPLIALMEDQVIKLQQDGFSAERIHSGRPFEESRAAARAWQNGELDFLYVAPERLGIERFAELLALQPPGLVAIDEAHCISQWGHDFRPDYRLLGERLPALRPAPVIALTATATPRVQRDIAEQLGLLKPALHIHGFRRDNIAIEVAEIRPGARAAVVARLLAASERRPAIVYAPTRKESENIASVLEGEFGAEAYHAGLPSARRDEVQKRFLEGDVDVVVATIAFGMGIDKHNVRSVVHTALPGTLEGYYQEIGRAGRDGRSSRAFLLWSWADRRTHEFFHGRDYPHPKVLAQIWRALGKDPRTIDEVGAMLDLDDEVMRPSVEKLWIHGGALVDPEENLRQGHQNWWQPYVAQRDHRTAQLEDMCRFAQGHACRMLSLVRHFGDQEDDGRACGQCDVCAPDEALALGSRAPHSDEVQVMKTILVELEKARRGQGTGRLFKDVHGIHATTDRGDFEDLLGGLARAGLVLVDVDSFEKDGRKIEYKRARLGSRIKRLWSSRRGGNDAFAADSGAAGLDAVLAAIRLPEDAFPDETAKKSRRSGGRRRSRAKGAGKKLALVGADAPEALVDALREWRLAEARRRKVPAFTILHDKSLVALAAAQPSHPDALLRIPGIGPTKADRWGGEWLEIVARHGGAASSGA